MNNIMLHYIYLTIRRSVILAFFNEIHLSTSINLEQAVLKMTLPLRKVSLTTSILSQMHFIFSQTFHIRASVLISLEMKSLDKLKTKNAYAKFK